MKSILSALALLVLAAPAFATDLAGQFKDVCASPAVKSEKLTAACQANAMPKAIKKGDRFAAVGIGAEVNTLAANLKFFTTETEANQE